MTAARLTPDADRLFRSRECRRAECDQCDGYYDTNGSTFGYGTYTCLCACHLSAATTAGEPNE